MNGELVGFTAVLCMFGGPMLVGIVWVVCWAWMKNNSHERETELKHRLLDAGMTADEIERVVNAGRPPSEEDEEEATAEAGAA